ncbi:MAG TPA: hypothetical protein VJP02_15455 [Candidatus Sulfotelmatobacter sp.]|nr:hypothetical protein [Candidatus Sulfotelmatobacter sp.]
MTTTPKQLSRVAGVPRLKLPIWKAAAAQFFQGTEPTREEQRNGNKKSKVGLLRELAATDPTVRSWVIKFAADMRSRDARAQATEQGLVMPDKLGFVALFPGDRPDLTALARTVICMEKPNAEELLAKLQTLYPDGDPPDVAERQAAELQALAEMKPPVVTHLCNHCGEPHTKAFPRGNGSSTYWCDKHAPANPPTRRPVSNTCDFPGCTAPFLLDFDGVRRCWNHRAGQSERINTIPPSADGSPASYINDGGMNRGRGLPQGFGTGRPTFGPAKLPL